MVNRVNERENKLNLRQERFVLEYVKDLNGKQAALRAGYAASTAEKQASRLLATGKVRARVDEWQADVARKCGIDAEYVLNGLKAIAVNAAVPQPITNRAGDVVGARADYNASVRAHELLGKHLGMFIEPKSGASVSVLIVERGSSIVSPPAEPVQGAHGSAETTGNKD
jgi:phage terminase small subunit